MPIAFKSKLSSSVVNATFVDATIDSIETFLGNKGVLSDSQKTIRSIVDELKKVRSKEITNEVSRRMGGVAKTAGIDDKGKDNLVQVLKNLLRLEDPDHVVPYLDEHYIIPLSGNTQQDDLRKKLHTLKSILLTSKSINWMKVGTYFGDDAVYLIKQIKRTSQ